ncbi:MAG: single-stranded-DNA-specific exonuclease RecJ [Rhodobacteraceae bacterium]|nr:single-stranded-DNA-specific exonuclease RecJ [Paracoccaceae bacterium]
MSPGPADLGPADLGPAYLGVTCSATGRRWQGPEPALERLAAAIAREAELPDPVALVLARRGVSPDEAAGFLAPALRDLLPDPSCLRDMDIAADRLARAARAGERIAIFADYDVDGGASAALLLSWLRALGRQATLYVPDRLEEGYGPNAPAMEALARAHDLILCVDCGTLSHDALAAAAGADVIVLDHHLGGETLPPALAVVNPNRMDEDGALSHLCAAGVVFLALVAANRALRGAGVTPLPDLLGLLDLVALATVADVAPLVGVNRALVRQGLAVMARRARPGLVALADVARMETAPAARHLGFVFGPRINAGGRVGQADLGARCLATDSPEEARALAARLEALNAERRAVEAAVREEAMAQAEARGTEGGLAWAAGEGWHAGVVGIVAARLAETTGRPAVVLGLEGDMAKGSGRSVAGVDLGTAVQRLAAEGLIARGGGHPMAAGMTVPRATLEAAMARLEALLARQGAGRGGPRDLRLDGVLQARAAQVALIEALEAAGPYGQGAPAPRFVLPGHRLVFVKRAGTSHVRLTLADDSGARIDAIAFGAAEGPLGPFLEGAAGGRIHAAGRLEIDTWGGRIRPKLRLDDAAPA